MASKTRQADSMTSGQEISAGFVDGDAVLDEILAEPGMRKAVDLIHEGTAHMDRVYAEGLAEIRKLAAQTQAGLADRMGVKQASSRPRFRSCGRPRTRARRDPGCEVVRSPME